MRCFKKDFFVKKMVIYPNLGIVIVKKRKKLKMRNFIYLLILFLFVYKVKAQTDSLTTSPDVEVFTDESNMLPDPVVTVEIDVRTAFTSGEFKQFYPKRGMVGFGIDVLFPITEENPVDFGAGLGYYFMSTSKRNLSFYTPGVGNYDVESRVNGGMFEFHLMSRVYPLKATNFPFQPYIEGLAGFRVFSANQRLETYIHDTGEYLPVEKDYNHTGSWSYGFGGGIKVRVSSDLIYVNLRANKIMGTPTKNMDPESVILYDDGTYSFDEFKSRTDIVRFSLGIHIMIE